MTLIGYRSSNHPQQVRKRGPRPDIDDRATTPEVFDPLNQRFRFTIDVAAATHNTKCARYFSIETDGLAQSWADERVWCNPPFSTIEPWVQKAWGECGSAELIVMLVPANRTEQAWWQELVEPHRDRGGGAESRVPPGPAPVPRPRPDSNQAQRAAAVRLLPSHLGQPRMKCPFVRAVSAGDLATARELSFADGGPCEDAVFEQLVEWARSPDALPFHGATAQGGAL